MLLDKSDYGLVVCLFVCLFVCRYLDTNYQVLHWTVGDECDMQKSCLKDDHYGHHQPTPHASDKAINEMIEHLQQGFS